MLKLTRETWTSIDLASNYHRAMAKRPRQPVVRIEESITRRYILCLECGRSCKLLKRHLRESHRLTPEEYRKRWGLHLDYPFVSAAYSDRRSVIARMIGFSQGKKARPAGRRLGGERSDDLAKRGGDPGSPTTG